VWVLFRSFEEGTKLPERVVWKVDFEDEDTHSVVRKLCAISKVNVEQIETLVKKVQILEEVWASLLEAPEEIIKALIPAVKNLIVAGYPSYQFQDAEIEDFVRDRLKGMIPEMPEPFEPTEESEGPYRKAERPNSMKLGGEVFEIQNSYEILVNTANWLIKKGLLKPSDCPVPAGHKRYLIHKEPKHKYGDHFRAPKKLSNGLFVETHYSTAGCVNYARRLLEKFGYRADTLAVG
jgi:hypothetical protein